MLTNFRAAAEGAPDLIRTAFHPGDLKFSITILVIMLKIASASEPPHVRIRANELGPLIDVPELWRFRDLLWNLAQRDLRVRYKQTALGVIWVILQPLIPALIFSFVFGFIAGLPSDGEPYLVFAFAGMTAWNVFASVLNRTSSSLIGNAGMVSKSYFPRLILPFSSVVSVLVDSAVSLILMFVMMGIYRIWPGWGIVFMPVWLLMIAVLALGIGLMTSSWMVRYRDVGHVIPMLLQLGMYVSPVVWSMANPKLSERFRALLRLNPLSSLLEAFRWSLFGHGAPPLGALAYALVVAIAAMWIGLTVFKQQERSFADVI
jgi:lipopolysaccharide transport system permease protein